MVLNETAEAGLGKKLELMNHDFGRFAVRAVLAGIYLTIATAFSGVAGYAVEQLAPGLGGIVFAFLFGFGLYAIIILGAELATGNMMFSSYGATTGQTTWGKAIWLVIVTTIFNLVGAILVALLLSQSAKFAGMDQTHLISTLTEGKLEKSAWGAFLEGIGANFVVNMAIVGASFSKDLVSKFFTIIAFLAIFVGLGLEHVIANFSLMTITFFSADPLPASMTLGSVLLNWLMVWLGNFVGGGLLIGAVYAWLNKTKTVYKD
ncbi:formate/nitrite transporter family protein [Rothia aerolata]|uniref:Formate transporter n=1 Tax=Rothia aerolata TaxID=1812262 RepID=A0A917IPH8_9MICC|nr:formate/nitrite transporter family protein [Rothia aerolata]GGH58639.1 formate transporter [Rothia aerolata]